jgi:hypothetical protein
MKPERIALMPHWPARMDETMAALYLGVSATGFREGVEARKYPAPVREGRRKLWAKLQLDRFVESQFGCATASGNDRTWDGLK